MMSQKQYLNRCLTICELIYTEEFDDKTEVQRREYAIKQLTRAEKEQLLKDLSSIKNKYSEEIIDTIKSLQDIWAIDSATDNNQSVTEIEGLIQDYGYRIVKEPDSKDDKRFVFQNVDTIKESYHAKKTSIEDVYLAKPAIVNDEEIIKGYAYVTK